MPRYNPHIAAATEATLLSIKDTAGIKKITDALPAGSNNIGGVTTIKTSGSLEVDGVIYPVFRDIISGSTSGDNTLIAAPGAGKVIRVVSINFIAAAAVGVVIEDSITGPDLTGNMPIAANSGMIVKDDDGIFEAGDNELLNMRLDAAVQVSGFINWIEITL